MKNKLVLTFLGLTIFSSVAHSSIFDVKEKIIKSEHPATEAVSQNERTQLNPCTRDTYTPVNAEANRLQADSNSCTLGEKKEITAKPLSASHITVIDTQVEIKNELQRLSSQVNELNKNFKQEINRLNTRIDKLASNTEITGAAANISEDKKSNEKTFRLSKEMQKAFSNSSTRDLKDIPERN